MIEAVTESCEQVISQIKPGMAVRDLVIFGDNYLEANGVSLSDDQQDPEQLYAAFPPHWGHGVGMTWERPWFIREEPMLLEKNMYIAIEKCLYKPGRGTVNYEQNLLVTHDGCRVLTSTKKRWF